MPFIADSSRAALRGVLYVALSAVAFGAMAIFGRYAYAGGADVLGLLIVRFSIAGALLVAVARRRRVRWPRGRALAAIVGMGALGYVGQSLCYFSALQHAQASLVALLLICTRRSSRCLPPGGSASGSRARRPLRSRCASPVRR